jgi:hypothetical protein
MNGGYT